MLYKLKMKFRHLTIWLDLFVGLIWSLHFCNGTTYLFLCEDEALFSNCDDRPDVLGIESFIDVSNLKVELHEESVIIQGDAEVIWDVEPTDRIDYKAELLKSARGGWEPTVFSHLIRDLCNGLFDENNLWFQYWGRFVNEEDRKCFNHKGTVYHHDPFELIFSFDITGAKMSGLHKIVMIYEAFDEDNVKRSEVCVQMLVDVVQK